MIVKKKSSRSKKNSPWDYRYAVKLQPSAFADQEVGAVGDVDDDGLQRHKHPGPELICAFRSFFNFWPWF